jgi:hypothetical protein
MGYGTANVGAVPLQLGGQGSFRGPRIGEVAGEAQQEFDHSGPGIGAHPFGFD